MVIVAATAATTFLPLKHILMILLLQLAMPTNAYRERIPLYQKVSGMMNCQIKKMLPMMHLYSGETLVDRHPV